MGVKLNEPVFALDNESTSFVIIFSFNISIISLGSLSGSTTLLVSTYKNARKCNPTVLNTSTTLSKIKR